MGSNECWLECLSSFVKWFSGKGMAMTYLTVHRVDVFNEFPWKCCQLSWDNRTYYIKRGTLRVAEFGSYHTTMQLLLLMVTIRLIKARLISFFILSPGISGKWSDEEFQVRWMYNRPRCFGISSTKTYRPLFTTLCSCCGACQKS